MILASYIDAFITVAIFYYVTMYLAPMQLMHKASSLQNNHGIICIT